MRPARRIECGQIVVENVVQIVEYFFIAYSALEFHVGERGTHGEVFAFVAVAAGEEDGISLYVVRRGGVAEVREQYLAVDVIQIGTAALRPYTAAENGDAVFPIDVEAVQVGAAQVYFGIVGGNGIAEIGRTVHREEQFRVSRHDVQHGLFAGVAARSHQLAIGVAVEFGHRHEKAAVHRESLLAGMSLCLHIRDDLPQQVVPRHSSGIHAVYRDVCIEIRSRLSVHAAVSADGYRTRIRMQRQFRSECRRPAGGLGCQGEVSRAGNHLGGLPRQRVGQECARYLVHSAAARYESGDVDVECGIADVRDVGQGGVESYLGLPVADQQGEFHFEVIDGAAEIHCRIAEQESFVRTERGDEVGERTGGERRMFEPNIEADAVENIGHGLPVAAVHPEYRHGEVRTRRNDACAVQGYQAVAHGELVCGEVADREAADVAE